MVKRCFIALAFGVFLFPGCATTGYQAHYEAGQKLLSEGQYPEAEQEFRAAVKARPSDGWAHYYWGEALAQTQDGDSLARAEYLEAGLAFRRLVKKSQQDADAHLGLGLSLGVLGKFPEAEAEFKEVAKLRPNDAVAYHNLGNALFSQGKYSDAQSAFEQAVRLKPDEPRAHLSLADVLVREGNTEASEKEYHEAIRLNPDDAQAHLKLQRLLVSQSRLLEADREQHEFYQVSRRNAEGFARKGSELLDKGDVPGALRQYGKSVQAFPQFAPGHYGLAACFALSGKRDDALKSLTDAVGFGFEDWPLMEKDPDLASLRADPVFKDLAGAVRKRWEEKQKVK